MKNRIFAFLFVAIVAIAFVGHEAAATLPSGNGQTTKAKSVSVAIASDQTVPVSGTITSTVDLSSLTQPTTTSAVTASDSTALTCTKGLWVGTAGNLSLKLSTDSSAVTWKNVPSGTFVPGSVIRVMSATTAADIVCLQ